MMDFHKFTHQNASMESVLNEYGLTGGIYSQFADSAYKDIRFLLIMNLITEEEAQTILNRIIAMVMRAIF